MLEFEFNKNMVVLKVDDKDGNVFDVTIDGETAHVEQEHETIGVTLRISNKTMNKLVRRYIRAKHVNRRVTK